MHYVQKRDEEREKKGIRESEMRRGILLERVRLREREGNSENLNVP